MDLARPRFAAREEVLRGRLERAERVRFEGLWTVGSLAGLAAPTVAIVGSRAPSEAARSRTTRLASELARAGVCIVSGLALGIDGAAHAGAVAARGSTIGVLGGGHARFFPPKNRPLAEAMLASGGAVLSPYAPSHPALPAQFLQRNGVVAALADVVVIVEAAARSGALNTASWAAALGVDVLAFPGDVDHPQSAGCNALIRDGATLVRDAADVLAAIGVGAVPALPSSATPQAARLCNGERAVLAALGGGPQCFETLLETTGESVPKLLAALVALELDGRLERRADTLAYALLRR